MAECDSGGFVHGIVRRGSASTGREACTHLSFTVWSIPRQIGSIAARPYRSDNSPAGAIRTVEDDELRRWRRLRGDVLMRCKEFWALIEAAAGRHDDLDARVDALLDELTHRRPSDITSFADHLAQALHTLDTPAHAAAAEAYGDTFLYIRCAVVAAGRAAYERVRRTPAAIAAFADQDAEPLLSAAEHAYHAATGMAWEHNSPVSYETGANHQAWGLPPADEPDAASPPQPAWLSVGIGSAIQPQPRPAYCHTFYALAGALDSDLAWQRWWQASGIPQVAAHPFFGDPYNRPRPGHPAAPGQNRASKSGPAGGSSTRVSGPPSNPSRSPTRRPCGTAPSRI
jgi:hypothetical protein